MSSYSIASTNNCKIFYFKNPVAWIAKSNLSLNELIGSSGPFSKLAAPGVSPRQLNELVESYGVQGQVESQKQIANPQALAKAVQVIIKSHPEISVEQVESIASIARNKEISNEELTRIWSTPTNVKSLMLGLTNWLFQEPQLVQRDFRRRISNTFWQVLHDSIFNKSGISKAEVESILSYFATHSTLVGAELPTELVSKVLSINASAESQHSHFVIGGTPFRSSIHPEFLENQNFIAVLKNALSTKDNQLGELAAKEYVRYLYYSKRGGLTRVELELLDLVLSNYPTVKSVVRTFDRHSPTTIDAKELVRNFGSNE